MFFVLIGWLSLSITEASTPINNTHKSHNNFGDKSYYIIDINGNLKTFCTYQKCETDFIFGCIPFRIVHEYWNQINNWKKKGHSILKTNIWLWKKGSTTAAVCLTALKALQDGQESHTQRHFHWSSRKCRSSLEEPIIQQQLCRNDCRVHNPSLS